MRRLVQTREGESLGSIRYQIRAALRRRAAEEGTQVYTYTRMYALRDEPIYIYIRLEILLVYIR